MSTDKPASKFDHGGFWDRYSSTWDTQGDGVYVPAPGTTDVLGAEWGDDREATDLTGWKDLGTTIDATKKQLAIQLDTAGQKFRYYLVWITKLPPSGQVGISEIVLFR